MKFATSIKLYLLSILFFGFVADANAQCAAVPISSVSVDSIGDSFINVSWGTPIAGVTTAYTVEQTEFAGSYTPAITNDPWINEFHYLNTGVDIEEGIEVAGIAGTDLSCYKLYIFKNSSICNLIDSIPLTGIIDNESNLFGALWFPFLGMPDVDGGIALQYNGGSCDCPNEKRILHTVAYRTDFPACGSVAPSTILENIVVRETASTPVGHSLQMTGTGTGFSEFSWSPPGLASAGDLNVGQEAFQLLEDGNPLSAVVNNLKPCTQYRIRMRALCSAGGSIYRFTPHFFTTDDIDAGAVTYLSGDLTSCVGSSTAIEVETPNLEFSQNYCEFYYGYALVDNNDNVLQIDAGYPLDNNVTPTTTISISGLAEGVYTIHGFSYSDLISVNLAANTFNDIDAGCLSFSDQPLVLTVGVPIANETIIDVTCNSLTNGEIHITPEGTFPVSYNWSPLLSNSGTQTGLAAGVYSVTITNSSSCTRVLTYNVGEPDVLNVAGQTTPVSCQGGSDGTATAVTTGGTAPYTYEWQDNQGSPIGQTSDVASNLNMGTYFCSVVDANNCDQLLTVNITEVPLLDILNVTSQQPTCSGDMDGMATVAHSGGTSPIAYLWNNGEITQTASMLGSGFATITITDANGCTDTRSQTILGIPPVSVSINLGNNALCNGSFDGRAIANATGGNLSGGYTYLWDNNESTLVATGLNAGNHILTVSDSKGCAATGSIVITEPDLLEINLIASVNISCSGGSDGSLDIQALGGTPPYSYLWGDGQVVSNPGGLSIGDHFLTLTDDNNCVTTGQFSLTEPDALVVSGQVVDVNCNGGDDGSIVISISGGSPPYVNLWSNAATTLTNDNLENGTYSVTVVDANFCQTVHTETVMEPSILTGTTNVLSDVSCNGNSDGSGSISAAGGISPYSYLWDNGEVTPTATNLDAANHVVTVTDANGCIFAAAVLIAEPSLLTSNIQSTSVSCFGGNNGTATIIPVGGNGGFTYMWSDGQITDTALNLSAGTYLVTVTDSNGCTTTNGTSVLQVAEIEPGITSTSVSCNGGSDGTSTVVVSGGTSPYEFQWGADAQNQTTSTATGLSFGIYSITITDDLGCIKLTSIEVDEPDQLGITVSAIPAELCEGLSSELSAIVTGGVEPYVYNWGFSLSQTPTVAPITDTDYVINVTDANNCSVSTSQLVEVFEIPRLTNTTDSLIVVLADLLNSDFELALDDYYDFDSDYDWELVYLDDVFTNQSNTSGNTTNLIEEKLYLRFPSLDRVGIAEYIVRPYVVTPSGNSCYGEELKIRVQVNPFVPPYVDVEITEILTPNGDDKNDNLDVYVNDENVGSYIVNVFNRSGALVFSGEKGEPSWNGTIENGGELVPDGPYWIIIESGNKIIYRSAVTVINSN